MREVTDRDAKNPVLVFEPDSAWKREQASPEVVRAAERWVSPVYARLEEARLEQRRERSC